MVSIQNVRIKSVAQLIQLLTQRRKSRKIAQSRLADFSGLHRKGIAKLEKGQADPKLSTLLKLADLLGVEVRVTYEEE